MPVTFSHGVAACAPALSIIATTTPYGVAARPTVFAALAAWGRRMFAHGFAEQLPCCQAWGVLNSEAAANLQSGDEASGTPD